MSENTGIDNALFPNAAEAQEAEAVWNEGGVLADKDSPVGTFQAEITDATIGHSKSSGRLQITYNLTILSGEYKGTEIQKYDGLQTAKQAKITRQQLERLGIDSKNYNLQQLPAVLLSLVGKHVVVSCKQNAQYYNINFTRLVNDDERESLAGSVSGGGSSL